MLLKGAVNLNKWRFCIGHSGIAGEFQIWNQLIKWHHHMKDNIEFGHLSKFDAFRSNRDQVTELRTLLKIHTNFSNFEQTFKRFYQIWDNWKILSWTYYLEIVEMKITLFAYFYEYYKNLKILRVYIVLGDATSKLETFVWILNNVLRFVTWSLFDS